MLVSAEATDREDEDDDSDEAHDAADDCHTDEQPLKFGVHSPQAITMDRPDRFPSAPGAAIFDFDETMIDLEAQHTFASEALCREMGADFMEAPESLRLGSGSRVIDDVRDLRQFFGWTEPVEKLFAFRQKVFDDACRAATLELLPGVERTVDALRTAGLLLAITSSADGTSIKAILRRFGLRDAFALIVDGSQVTRGKPDPEAYLLTAERLSVAPPSCIVFEDSHVGVAAAKAAGMYCVAIRNPRAQLRQNLDAADVVLENFEEFDVACISDR